MSLFFFIIIKNGEPFWEGTPRGCQRSKSEENSAGHYLPFHTLSEENIMNALSSTRSDSKNTRVTEHLPLIKTLTDRLGLFLSSQKGYLVRKRDDREKIVMKERDGTAFFIKESSVKPFGVVRTRGKALVTEDMTSAFVYEKAREWLNSNGDILGIDVPAEEMEGKKVWQDQLGGWHIKLKQVFKGIDVFGAEVVLHCNEQGEVFCMTGRYHPTPDILLPKDAPIISSKETIERLKKQKPDLKETETEAWLVCLFDRQGKSHLAWHVHVQGKSWLLNKNVFIDARTGEIINEIDLFYHSGDPSIGSGNDLFGITRLVNTYQMSQIYYLIDTSKDMFKLQTSIPPYYFNGAILCFDLRNQSIDDFINGGKVYFFTSFDNKWNDPYAVSALYNTSLAYNYFRDTFGLKSFDREGSSIYLLNHFGKEYNNAGWNGHFIIIGDGDGKTLSGIPAALDVITHELGHAVVEYRANFIYQGQSGALHEAYADFFGVMSDPEDWLIGEDITINYSAVRDFAHPSNPDVLESLAEHMDQYENLPLSPEYDNGGVHRNVGIINRASYLIVQALGRDKTEKIYYRALDVYLTRYSLFIDMKLALAQSALDLYGEDEKNAVNEAFSTVGIISDQGSSEQESLPVQSGEEWILYVRPDDDSLWIIKPDGSGKKLITSTPVEGRPAVIRNGKILFIDKAHNIRGIDIHGMDEKILSSAGIWQNIAISPNLDAFAVTILPEINTIINAQKIYYVSLDEEGAIKEINLTSPITTQDGEGRIGYIFPGDMDFNYDGNYILFDAYHVLEWDNEHKITYWDINRVHISDAVLDRPLPSLGPNEDIGNPAFAASSSTILAYDIYNKGKNTFKTLITNTKRGDNLLICDGSGFIGSFPSFSPDNKHIAYTHFDKDNKRFTIRIMEIKEGFNAVRESSDHALLSNGVEVTGLVPEWFQIDAPSDQNGEGSQYPTTGNNPTSKDVLFNNDAGGCFIGSLVNN